MYEILTTHLPGRLASHNDAIKLYKLYYGFGEIFSDKASSLFVMLLFGHGLLSLYF
jgi:hypothetical protein